MEHESKYSIGDKLKDKVSGFTGIVMNIAFYATGCTHYGLAAQKPKSDGALGDWEYFDESRLTSVKKKAVSFAVKDPSGPEQNPPQM